MSVSSSSWGLGRAAVCDCGTPWTFLLPFLPYVILFLCFPVLFSIVITLIREETANLSGFVRLFDLHWFGFVCFSSSWCPERAAAGDCCTPLTFLLLFVCMYIARGKGR